MENAGEIMTDDELPGFEPVSDTVAKLRERIEINEQRKTLTTAQRKLLDQSAVIFGEPATKQDAAYLPRELVQVTLPHKNPGDVPVWTRSNGNLTVGIQSGMNLTALDSYGYPLRHRISVWKFHRPMRVR